MALDFTSVLGDLEGMGLYQVVLPFLLVFVLTYGILSKVNIFGNASERINPIISLIIAFFFIRSIEFVEVVTTFFPKVSLYIIVVFGLMLILALFGRGADWGENAFSIFVIATVIFIIWAAYDSFVNAGLNWFKVKLPDLASIVVVAVIYLVLSKVWGGSKIALKDVGNQFPKAN